MQKLAFATRELTHGGGLLPFSDPGFVNQVRIAVDEFVAEGGDGGLQLPALSGDQQDETEIEAANVRAVGLIYAAYQLEQMRLFDVVDRMTEIFMNGMLPVGFDAAGKALDDYYWSAEDRLSSAARHMQYSRVLGAPGGDISQEVSPNSEFDALWLRFLASLYEFDRSSRLSEIVDRGPRGSTRPGSTPSRFARRAATSGPTCRCTAGPTRTSRLDGCATTSARRGRCCGCRRSRTSTARSRRCR